jgi:hypothetical protein
LTRKSSELAELSDHGLCMKLRRSRLRYHNFASVGRFPTLGVGYFRVVPMSKVRAFAGFDLAEILMLTASVAVIAAITFVF